MMIFNNNNPRSLQRELQGVSKGLGNAEVETIFSGSGASAARSTIWLPTMPADATLTDEQMRVFRGYHIHEVGHILYTDDSAWENAVRNYQFENMVWKKNVLNALEDVFIERKINEAYAGAKHNLEETVERVLAKNLQQINDAGHKTSPDELPYVILQMCRKRMGYRSQALDDYLDQVSVDMRGIASTWVPHVLAADSTSRCVELTEEIVDVIEQMEQQPESDQPEEGDGPGNGTGQDEGRERKGINESEEEDSTQEDEEGTQSNNATSNRADGELKLDDLINNTLEDIVEEEAKTVSSTSDDPSYELPHRSPDIVDTIYRAGIHEDHMDRLGKVYDDHKAKLGKQLRKRSSSLARVLSAQENEFWFGGKTHGRLDRNRMVGVVTGEENIFAERITQQTASTSVMVMMDQSGSMNFNHAKRALIVLNETLARSGVPYSVIGWSTDTMQMLKSFKQKGLNESVRRHIGGFGDFSGGTDPFPSLIRGYEAFNEGSQAARRIMLFCSDAEFYLTCSHRMAKLNAEMEQHGFEAYGMLIGNGNPHSLELAFPRGIVVTDFRRMAETLLKQLEQLLAKGAQRAVA
jgi:cobalamin biosynthesis protein CobT